LAHDCAQSFQCSDDHADQQRLLKVVEELIFLCCQSVTGETEVTGLVEGTTSKSEHNQSLENERLEDVVRQLGYLGFELPEAPTYCRKTTAACFQDGVTDVNNVKERNNLTCNEKERLEEVVRGLAFLGIELRVPVDPLDKPDDQAMCKRKTVEEKLDEIVQGDKSSCMTAPIAVTMKAVDENDERAERNCQ
jgi:hypothetical protein